VLFRKAAIRRGVVILTVLAVALGTDAAAVAAEPLPRAAQPFAPAPTMAPTAAPVATVTSVATVVSPAATNPRVGVSVLRSSGSVRLAATATDGSFRLYHNRPGGPFLPALNLGGPILGTPAVLHDDATGRYDVFVVGPDHRLRVRSRVGNVWRPWQLVGSTVFASGPDVVRSRDGDVHVFAVAMDNRIREVVLRRGAVVVTRLVGGNAKGSPAVTYAAGGRYVVFWTGVDGRLWRSIRTGNRWSEARAISVVAGFTGGIGATRQPNGIYSVVATRANNVYLLRTTSVGWGRPTSLGGGLHGKPDITSGPTLNQLDIWAVGTDGRIKKRTYAGGTWRPWDTVTGASFGTTATPAQQLMKRWGGALGGTPAAHADLAAAAAGRSVVGPCGTSTTIDPRLIVLLLKITDRYRVTLNNLVTGRSCDSGRHPRGAAIDFWTVTDPRSGATTNFDSWRLGDNQSLNRQFIAFLAANVGAGAGLGQRYCPGQSSARIPASIIWFSDACNHQHVQLSTS